MQPWLAVCLSVSPDCFPNSAKPESCKNVDANTLLLLDSGCQYDCGTTDITRTFHTGTPSEFQRRCFTRVLQVRTAKQKI